MDSPARKLLKQKDYQRHKMFRKMARKRKAKAEQEQKVAEKALKRKLKLPKYDKGDKPNLFKQGNRYFYQESPESKEISVTPINTTFDNPAYWTYQDAEGRIYTPKQLPTSDPGEIKPAEQKNVLESALDNYVGELKYDLNNNVPVGGKYTMPAIAASALLPLAGEYIAGTSIAGIPTTTLMNNAIGLGFAGHGLNHLFNEGINGYGDAAMTALELSPLGKLSLPIYRTGKAFASPFVLLVVNDGKWLWNEGNIIQKTIPYNPNNFYRGVGKEALKDAKESGVIRGKYFKSPYFGKAKDWWNDGVVYEGTPERIDWIDAYPYDEEGKVIPFSNLFPFNALPYENGSTIVPTKNFSYWLKHPIIGWRKHSFENVKIPIITADNAASMTPEQWTAAQDAAIARGDMAEAQRLRDLHFKVNTPGNVVTKEGVPTHNYHGTDSEFNTFDIRFFGRRDNGDRGRGFYFSENRNVSEDYGPIVKDSYLYAKTPYKGFKNNEKYLGRGKSKDEIVQYLTQLHRESLENRVRRMIEQQKSGNHSPTYNNLGITKDMSEQEIRNLVNKAYNHEHVIPYEVGNLDEADVFLSPYENVVYKPNQIKSADAVTFDDKGVRIPLGERDNFNMNDIRYGLIPFLGLGAAAYQNYNRGKKIKMPKYDSGTETNVFRKADGSFVYQENPNSEEIPLTPLLRAYPEPKYWTYTDANGKMYTPKTFPTINQGEIKQGEAPSFLDEVLNVSNNYYNHPILGAPARWQSSWNNNTNPVKALWNSPFVFANPYIFGIKTISNLASEEGIPKTIRLFNNSNGSLADKQAWQRSLIGDLVEATMLFPAINEAYSGVKKLYNPWIYKIPENPNMAYRRMGPLERDWLMEGNELSTRSTNVLTKAEEAAARTKGRFNIFKAGAEHGGRKQFAKGQPWKGTTVTHGEEQVLAIPGKDLPWVSGKHYRGPQGSSFGVGELSFDEVPFGSHIDLMTNEAGFSGVNPSLLEGSVIYQPFHIFGHKFGYKKLYPRLQKNQSFVNEDVLNSSILSNKNAVSTSEVMADASDFSSANDLFANSNFDNNKFILFMYQDMLLKSKSDITYSKLLSDKVVDKQIPDNLILIYKNSIIPRLEAARPGYHGGIMYPTIRVHANKALKDGYTVYPEEVFLNAGEDKDIVGIAYDKTGHISIKDGYDDFALGHEVRHRLLRTLAPTTDESFRNVEAYGDEFIKLSEEYPELANMNMGKEMDTTTYDARRKLLGDNVLSTWNVDLLNIRIDKTSDEAIVNAFEKANGYGKKLIETLKKQNKLTPERILALREVLKHNGAIAVPIAVGAATYQNYDRGKSGIHIKPSKRGTFTAAAKRRGMGVQEFARKVLSAPKGKYSSAMRKKANFARNASKFKH